MKPIYYNKNNRQYYYYDQQCNLKCDDCGSNINSVVLIKQYFLQGEFIEKKFCTCCGDSKLKTNDYNKGAVIKCLNLIVASVVYERPEGIIIVDPRPDFKVSNSLSAVSEKLDCFVIDKTRFAGKESLEGASIGAKVRPDKVLRCSDVKPLLLELKEAKTFFDKEQLEFKNEV